MLHRRWGVMRLDAREKLALLVAGDIFAILLSFAIALAIGHRRVFSVDLYIGYGWSIVVLSVLILTVFVIIDAYSSHLSVERFLRHASLILLGLAISGIFGTFFIFFFRSLVVSRGVFLLFLFFSYVFITFFRYLNNRLVDTFIIWNILLVGDRQAAVAVLNLLNSKRYLHYRIVGYLCDEPNVESDPDMPFLGRTDGMSAVMERDDIDQVIVTQTNLGKDLIRLLLECMQKRVEVTDFKRVIEEVTGKVPIEYLDEYWFIMELRDLNKKYFWYAKRTIDIIISLVGIVLTLPFLPVVALIIKIDSPGPVMYFQTRVGRRGKTFRVWKLRTMVRDADKNNVHWTAANDSRITRLGGFLRKVRLDEFPQFVNILKGDMTLIGPRPEAESLVRLYAAQIPFYAERHMVTPGVTGWAQINYRYGNSIEDAREKLKYDLYYIKNRDLILDLIILLKTIRTVVTGRGAI